MKWKFSYYEILVTLYLKLFFFFITNVTFLYSIKNLLLDFYIYIYIYTHAQKIKILF